MKSLWVMVFLLSCASADHQLAFEVPVEKARAKEENPPHLKRYKRKSKELIYIAVRERGNTDDKTMKLIKDTLIKFDPEYLVVEYPVQDPHLFSRELSQCEQNLGCSASAYTCQVGRPAGILCVSGEPFDSEIFQRAKKAKLTSEQIVFFATYRELVNKEREKKNPLEHLEKIIEEQKNRLGTNVRFDGEEFYRMYKDNMADKIIRLNPAFLKPDATGHYLQKISAVLDEIHETSILEKIEKGQLDHERVMVVYGVSHYRKHKILLEEFFASHFP